MIDMSKVAENGLTLLVLAGLGYFIWSNSKGGAIKDKLRDWFGGGDG